MKTLTARIFGLVFLLSAHIVMAQAFGDYGRATGAVPRDGSPRARGMTGVSPKHSQHGMRDAGGKPMAALLVVASKQAFLYPRQDDESEELEKLNAGDTLVPMMQTRGGSEWYMVKTQQGVIGWIKSSDVREQSNDR